MRTLISPLVEVCALLTNSFTALSLGSHRFPPLLGIVNGQQFVCEFGQLQSLVRSRLHRHFCRFASTLRFPDVAQLWLDATGCWARRRVTDQLLQPDINAFIHCLGRIRQVSRPPTTAFFSRHTDRLSAETFYDAASSMHLADGSAARRCAVTE
jgi:hypothetical protein